MNDPADAQRFVLRLDAYGTWSVIDGEIDFPVVVRDKLLICLDEAEASDAASLLNLIDRMRLPRPASSPVATTTHPLLQPIR
jgi:hypothetical protein